jgi:hypothetical protein
VAITEADLRTEREVFFELAVGAYERAERCAGAYHWYGALGGHTVHLRCAGSYLLEQVGSALAHLKRPPGSPDLDVLMWDNRSSDTVLPRLLRSFIKDIRQGVWTSLDSRHELRHLNDDRFRAVYRLSEHLNILSLYDEQTCRAVYWMEDASLLPYWEKTQPLQTIFNWWAESRDLQYVHAAAVGLPGGAVLLTAPGGSGKSTTALACLGSELAYLADDYCLIGHGPARVFSLYCMAKLVGEADFERLPLLRSWIDNPQRGSGEKAILNLYRHCPDKLLAEAPIKAVVVPVVVSGSTDSRLLRLRGASALLALAPTTLFQLAGSHQDCLSRMSRMLREVPCYRLELGSELGQIPPLLQGLIESQP